MKHLDDKTLSGILDGELRGEALWRAQQHLEKCASCRDALAALSAQDDSLKPALSHDPGDEYFEGFAEKVTDRIAAGKSGLAADAGHATRGPIRLPWWQRSGVVVAAGSAMAIIAGAGVVMIASRNAEMPGAAREREIAGRIEQTAPPRAAAPEASAPGEPSSGIVTLSPLADSMARAPALLLTPARQEGERGAAASRLQKVDKLESGEERSSAVATGPGFALPPRAAAPESAGKSRWLDLKRAAHGPLSEAKGAGRREQPRQEAAGGAPAADLAAPPAAPAPSPAAREAGAVAQNEVAVRRDVSGRSLCGVVHDSEGRPLKGVSISAIDVAGIATTDAAGHFCIDVPGGSHTVQFMAIGFNSARVVVPATYGAEISVTLSAVSALHGGMAYRSEAKTQPLTAPAPLAPGPGAAGGVTGSQETLASDEAALRALPDSLREAVAAAERLQSGAMVLGRASALDAAAAAWERILPHMPPDRSEIETRARLAECRFRAWQLGPDARRAERAMDALTSYIVRASVGEKRNLAARWLDSIHSR